MQTENLTVNTIREIIFLLFRLHKKKAAAEQLLSRESFSFCRRTQSSWFARSKTVESTIVRAESVCDWTTRVVRRCTTPSRSIDNGHIISRIAQQPVASSISK